MDFQQALNHLHNAKEKQKKRQKRNAVICIPIGVALGLAISLLDNLVLKDYENGMLRLMLMLLITLPIQLILHEAGHLVFGLATHYRFSSFRVFSFAILKKDGKLFFGRYRVPGTLGQCLLVPPDEKELRIAPLLLGGVILNSASAAVCLLLLFLFESLASLLFFFLVGMTFWGIVLALSNGIPQNNGIIANDGYHAKTLPKDAAARFVFFNQLRISAAMTEGKRLSEMPDAWFTVPENEAVDPTSVSLFLLQAEREVDAGRLDRAREILFSLACRGENLPEALLSAILTELLYHEMVGSHRHEVVETLRYELASYLKITKNSFTALRIDITYHYLFTGDMKTIAKLQKRFESFAKHYPFVGEVAKERTLLAYPETLYRTWRDTLRG